MGCRAQHSASCSVASRCCRSHSETKPASQHRFALLFSVIYLTIHLPSLPNPSRGEVCPRISMWEGQGPGSPRDPHRGAMVAVFWLCFFSSRAFSLALRWSRPPLGHVCRVRPQERHRCKRCLLPHAHAASRCARHLFCCYVLEEAGAGKKKVQTLQEDALLQPAPILQPLPFLLPRS